MAAEVKLSSLGVSITEGTIVRWLKKEGESVEKRGDSGGGRDRKSKF